MTEKHFIREDGKYIHREYFRGTAFPDEVFPTRWAAIKSWLTQRLENPKNSNNFFKRSVTVYWFDLIRYIIEH
jgi:hypothetical protein